MNLYSTVWVNFSKLLIKPTNYCRFQFPNLTLRLALQKQKSNGSVIVTRIWLSIWTDKFEYPSGLKKKQDLRLFHQKVWTLRWSIPSYRSRQPGLPRNQTSLQGLIFCCLQVWHFWEQFRCVAHSSLFVGKTIALLFSFGTCIVRIQSVRVNSVCLKRLFKLSAEAVIEVRNAHLCARCAIALLRIKIIPFLSFGQRVYIFEESPKAIQDVIGDVYCPGEYCLNREQCESLGGYLTTPRSIYGCGKCGACLFVHKIPFILQEHVKTTKTDKTHFFLLKKSWICYPTNNFWLSSLLGTIPDQ